MPDLTLYAKMRVFPVDVKENTHIHKVLLPLRIFGAVIYCDQRHKSVIFGINVFCSINLIPICAMQIYALHPDNWSSIDNASISAASAILHLSAGFQIIRLMFRRKDIITYVAKDGKRFYLSKEESEQQIHNKYIAITKYIYISLYVPAFITIITVIFTSAIALNNNDAQVFEAGSILEAESVPFLFLMFPFTNSTKNYFIAYIYPYIPFLAGALFISGWHTTMPILLLYPNYIFKLVKVKLEKLDEIPESKLNQELVSLIKLQVQATKLTERLESFISGSVFIDFILFSVLICFLLYQLSENKNNETSDLVILILFFFAACLLQLFYNAIGNEIHYQADILSTAFYMSSWYKYPLSVQKTGVMIMIGSARPIQMKAMYIDMRLSTFLNIIRASYGYYAMLKNVNRLEKRNI